MISSQAKAFFPATLLLLILTIKVSGNCSSSNFEGRLIDISFVAKFVLSTNGFNFLINL